MHLLIVVSLSHVLGPIYIGILFYQSKWAEPLLTLVRSHFHYIVSLQPPRILYPYRMNSLSSSLSLSWVIGISGKKPTLFWHVIFKHFWNGSPCDSGRDQFSVMICIWILFFFFFCYKHSSVQKETHKISLIALDILIENLFWVGLSVSNLYKFSKNW